MAVKPRFQQDNKTVTVHELFLYQHAHPLSLHIVKAFRLEIRNGVHTPKQT